MFCKSIELCNFRNTELQRVSFDRGINILHGENAQGKTNLLEGVYYVSLGKSFRTSRENEIIRFGEDFASISLDFEGGGRDQNVTMRFSNMQKKTVTHNGVKITKLSELVGKFRAVLFCPDHLQMIKEGPALRRSYLDVAISQIRPIYLHSLQRYNKILKQRNGLIKSAEGDRATFNSTVDFWSQQLAAEAAVITAARYEYICRSAEIISEFYARMSERENIRETPALTYQSSSKLEGDALSDIKELEARYFKRLSENHDREIAAGATLYGVHKDDLIIDLNGKNTRLFTSQGQQRSLALAMKLAESEICRLEGGEYPVLLFDDVFSELDSARRKNLLREIADRQVIITSCENDLDFPVGHKRIEVSGGKYFEA